MQRANERGGNQGGFLGSCAARGAARGAARNGRAHLGARTTGVRPRWSNWWLQAPGRVKSRGVRVRIQRVQVYLHINSVGGRNKCKRILLIIRHIEFCFCGLKHARHLEALGRLREGYKQRN